MVSSSFWPSPEGERDMEMIIRLITDESNQAAEIKQRDPSYKERTVQAFQAAQRFASHSPSVFEYASNFYYC